MAGLIIPTPEVSDVKDDGFYDKNYPADYKMPRQLIHVQRNFCAKKTIFQAIFSNFFIFSFVTRAGHSRL